MIARAARWPALPLGAAVASWIAVGLSGLPLVWDGSYFLLVTLNDSVAFVPSHRLGVALFDLPVVWAQALTEDMAALRLVFSLSYAIAPLAALLLSWFVVRAVRPDLFVWPMLGVGLALVQGRALGVAGSEIAAELAWPLLLAAVLPPRRSALLVGAAAGLVAALAHPAASLLLVAAGVAGVLAAGDRRERALWGAIAVALLAVNVVALTSRLDEYEVESAQPLAVAYMLSSEVGPQLAALVLVTLAGWSLYRGGSQADPLARHRLHMRAAVAVALAAVPLLLWAADGGIWREVVGFRAWSVPAAAPLLVLCALDARSGRSAGPDVAALRRPITSVAALVMLAVVLVQCTGWLTLSGRVRDAVAARSGCVDAASIDGYAGSPLDNWTITPLSAVSQGRDVRAFIAPASVCASAHWPDALPLPFGAPLVPRWFRFR